ncbi:MAG: Xanthine and CO dehydrogenases maturation factor, XdhC/CoxF family, partial [uncultured Rubrobacteraceae bacterium]
EPGRRQGRKLERGGQEGRPRHGREGREERASRARHLDGHQRGRAGRGIRERRVRGARGLRGGDGGHRERHAEASLLRHLRRRGVRGGPDVRWDHPYLRREGRLV